jgi:ParB family chromosome partitioning protein
MKKSPLGRGLESLIPKGESTQKSPVEVDITDIIPNSEQPRQKFDSEKLIELAESIKSKGLIQPIIVTKQGEKYVIIAGERRWRACGLAGLKKIPVIVKDINDDKERLELALIENIQREDLNSVEVAVAYKNLIEKFGYTQEELAKIVGKSRSAVANLLRLLKLPKEVINSLSENEITEGHARALLGLEEKDDILNVLRIVVKRKLSVRETERLIQRVKKEGIEKESFQERDVFIDALEKEFEEFFKTKVNIKQKKNGGTIEIKYTSNDELNTILEMIRGRDD